MATTTVNDLACLLYGQSQFGLCAQEGQFSNTLHVGRYGDLRHFNDAETCLQMFLERSHILFMRDAKAKIEGWQRHSTLPTSQSQMEGFSPFEDALGLEDETADSGYCGRGEMGQAR